MAYKGLADYLEELAGSGELMRIDAEVDPHLEIAEITRRVAAAGGPALLFERVRGQSLALLTNLLGTTRRACDVLGLDTLDGIAERIEAVAAEYTPQNWFDRLKMSASETGTEKFRPKPVKTGASQQVVHLGRDVNLAAFPLVRSWPEETGASVTAGLLLTQGLNEPTGGTSSCPLVSTSENCLAVVDADDTHFASHWAEHRAAGQRMPVAVVLGGDPAALVASRLELPPALEVLHLVGLLRGKPVETVKCRTHDLQVPADAELIVEGYFDPETSNAHVQASGAGGQHYRVRDAAPVMQVTAVTHRNRAIFPALIETGQRGESAVLAKARERLLLVSLQTLVPELVDLSLPILGGPHTFAVVSMRKRYAFQARQIAAALWGTSALRLTKFLILVDASVNVHQHSQVWSQVGANVAPERDVFPFDGPAAATDHAGTMFPLARHLAIDATTKLPGEHPGVWPAALDVGEEIRRQVTARWAEFRLPETGPGGD